MTADPDIRGTNYLNLQPTPVLNHDNSSIRKIAAELQFFCTSSTAFLRLSHSFLSGIVKPVYTLDEFQPASVTLAKGRGSCSQRMACLEALARANNIATRVH